jgi:hypothetical protein
VISAVGSASSAHEAAITRRRPTRSDSGPITQAPTAMPATTTVIVSPVAAGPASRSAPISGRIAWVE